MKNNNYNYAGIFMIIGTIQYILAVNISEALYPAYNVAINSLSDLGGSIPMVYPAATIFNASNNIRIMFISSYVLYIES